MNANNLAWATIAAVLAVASTAGAISSPADHANPKAVEHANDHSSLLRTDGPIDGAATAPQEFCDGYRNHGDYVSEQAKEDGNASAAAGSDVGKCRDGAHEPDGSDTADDVEQTEATDADEPGKSEGRGGDRGKSSDARDEHQRN